MSANSKWPNSSNSLNHQSNRTSAGGNKLWCKTYKSNMDDKRRRKTRYTSRWYQYCRKRNLVEYTRETSNPNFSHTLMKGGILNVPIEDYATFLNLVARDIDDGMVPDLNEIATPLNRLYIDLDFKAESTDDNDVQLFSTSEIKTHNRAQTGCGDGKGTAKFPAIVVTEVPLERTRYHNCLVIACIAKTVAKYFPDEPLNSEKLIVHAMWRKSRFDVRRDTCVDENGNYVRRDTIVKRSFGMHLVWQELYVTAEQALDIREGILRALCATFKEADSVDNRARDGLNSWADVVDENVYLPMQSMRMVACDKYKTCPDCVDRNLHLFGTKKAPKSIGARSKKARSTVKQQAQYQVRNSHCRCSGSGKVECNSIYTYQTSITATGLEVHKLYGPMFEKDTGLMLQMCCIRDPSRPDLVRKETLRSTDPVFKLPKNAPVYPNKSLLIPGTKRTNNSVSNRQHNAFERKKQFDQTRNSLKPCRDYPALQYGSKHHCSQTEALEMTVRGEMVTLDMESREFQIIQQLFNQTDAVQMFTSKRKKSAAATMTPNGSGASFFDFNRYQGIVVHNVRRGRRNKNLFYIVDVTDTGETNAAQYCHNARRVHSCAKNVYFKITMQLGIVQRCNCRGSVQSKPMSCLEYQSPRTVLPAAAQKILFDDVLQRMASSINADLNNVALAPQNKTSAFGKTQVKKSKDRDSRVKSHFEHTPVLHREQTAMCNYIAAKMPHVNVLSGTSVETAEEMNSVDTGSDIEIVKSASASSSVHSWHDEKSSLQHNNLLSCSSASSGSPLQPEEQAKVLQYNRLKNSTQEMIDLSELDRKIVEKASAERQQLLRSDDLHCVNNLLLQTNVLSGSKRKCNVFDPAHQYAESRKKRNIETSSAALSAIQSHHQKLALSNAARKTKKFNRQDLIDTLHIGYRDRGLLGVVLHEDDTNETQ